MTLNEISNIRICNQKVAATEFRTAGEIVAWMGAIQAQDYSMSKWAIGARLLDSTDEKIEGSFNKGEIIRTHLMRPTWHFVPAEDVYWMLELTAPRIKASLKSRHKSLELSGSIFRKSNHIIEKSLSGGLALRREDLDKEFKKAMISTDANRLSHLLLHAELDGIICSGPVKDNKQTFSLLSQRVPDRKVFSRDDSLAKLAMRYFNSHSPATIQDFAWWSGLSQKDAAFAMDSVKQNFIAEIIGSKKYLFPNSLPAVRYDKTDLHLLPAYDEFLISYRDRSASLLLADNKKTISANGIFYPVVVLNGQVTGLWRRSMKNGKIIIEILLYKKHDRACRELAEKKAYEIGRFLNRTIEVR
jgi:hypothetical protein